MKKVKIAFGLNVAIFILELVSNLSMFFGINLFGGTNTLTAMNYHMFKYFTIDSNVLMGAASLILMIYLWQVMKGTRKELPVFCYVISLVGTVGVTLTMLVTVFFLVPTYGSHWMSLFANSNMFLHLVNPILSIIVFVVFLKSRKISFKAAFTGIIPMVIYGIYYMGNAVGHSVNNVVPKEYDWYGFLVMGPKSAVIILPGITVITYIISVVLWRLNRSRQEEKI